MINGVRLKVCGLTSLVDADAADSIGADHLGFIFHRGSPRYVDPAQIQAMAARLPPRKRVAVVVEPSQAELEALRALDFDAFQIHFRPVEAGGRVAEWSGLVGKSALWLAPRLPPHEDVDPAWRDLAGTILLDTFHPDKFGGTGITGDWTKFRRHRDLYPETTWVLSGGLNPSNVARAITESGATFLDVNSGVELSPGIKDPRKLEAFAAALRSVER